MTTTTRSGFLFILGGLPGTGKTTLARALATRLSALYIRIDSLEQALVNAGLCAAHEIQGAGYEAAYALAGDNLRLGATVVSDSVNPLALTRAAWRKTAEDAGAEYREIEVVCSDAIEHRRRVETRTADIPGMRLPSWTQTIERHYEPWTPHPLVLDTARLTTEQAIDVLMADPAITDRFPPT